MADSDGADELVSGVGRVAVTGLGVVAENALRRRAEQDRARAEQDRARADADRARTTAVEEVTAVAVLRRDDRTREPFVDRLGWDAYDRGDGPEPAGEHPDPVRRAELAAAREAYRAQPAGTDTERAPRLATPLEPDVAGARDLAARSFAQAAAAATAPAAAAKGRPARSRARGTGAERDRGR